MPEEVPIRKHPETEGEARRPDPTGRKGGEAQAEARIPDSEWDTLFDRVFAEDEELLRRLA